MTPDASERGRLSRARVIEAAIALADRDGIEKLTIRALAKELGTKPMSLYHYFDGKEGVLGAMVEAVFDQIALPDERQDWKRAIRERYMSARGVFTRHPWAVTLMDSRTAPGPVSLQHHEAVLATFARGGMPLPLMAHAYSILDSFVYGFAIQETNLPAQGGEMSAELAAEITQTFDPERYPHLTRLAVEHVMKPDYAFRDSFTFGLDILLDGIEAAIPRD